MEKLLILVLGFITFVAFIVECGKITKNGKPVYMFFERVFYSLLAMLVLLVIIGIPTIGLMFIIDLIF